MRSLVLYYSRTGNTQKVARHLAAALGGEVARYTCKAYCTPLVGPIRQMVGVFSRATPPIELPDEVDAPHDLVIMAGPVWVARPAAPLRAVLRMTPPLGRFQALFLTCDGTSKRYPGGKALAEAESLMPNPPIASHLFRAADVNGSDFEDKVRLFADELSRAAAPATRAISA